MSAAQCVRMVGTSVIIKLYPGLVAAAGLPVMFAAHAAAIAAAAAFVVTFLPVGSPWVNLD